MSPRAQTLATQSAHTQSSLHAVLDSVRTSSAHLESELKHARDQHPVYEMQICALQKTETGYKTEIDAIKRERDEYKQQAQG